MTAIMNRPNIPEILPTRHARPALSRRLWAALIHARDVILDRHRTWSWGVVAVGALMLLVPVCEEIAEVAGYDVPPTAHLILAGVAFGGVAIYLLHKGTSDLK